MNSRVDAVNRAVLTFFGLLFLAAGGLGLALSFGVFGKRLPVLPEAMREYAKDQGWFWWAVAAGCVVLAALGVRWLLAQLRTDRVARLDLTADERDGVTLLHAGALTSAVEDEAKALRGVTGASAHLRDVRGRRLSLTVELADYADIADLRNRLEGELVGRARQATDDPMLPVDIELRPGRARSGGRGLR